MLVTLLGMVMLVSPAAPLIAEASMLVTLLGMVKETSVFPTRNCIKVVLFLLYNTPFYEVYALFSAATFIAVRLLHLEKALFPMMVTLSDMVMLVRLVQ